MLRGLRAKYAQSGLGLGWAILQPLVMVCVYTLIFGKALKMMGDGGPPYPLWVICGLLPWRFFAKAFSAGAASLTSNANLISKVYFPRLVLPLAAVVGQFPVAAAIGAMTCGFMLWFGYAPTAYALALPLLLGVVLATAVGASCWATALSVQFRDINHGSQFAIRMAMYAGPVVYPITVVDERWQPALGAEPDGRRLRRRPGRLRRAAGHAVGPAGDRGRRVGGAAGQRGAVLLPPGTPVRGRGMMNEPLLQIAPSSANPPPIVFGPPRPAISVRGLGKAFRIGLPPGAKKKAKGVRGALAAPLANFKSLAKLDVAADAAAAERPPAPELILPGHPSYIGPVRPLPDPSSWRCLGDIDLMADTVRRPAVEHDLVWALRDVTFTVGQGQVVGVVGRNGAGKSTLLKVLSRITDPTVGRAEIRGRVCSLLEVGTGFHKELTGRENVYMNGTVLGMTRREIDAAFDEIVDFSGVEEFLDTPVKRYSSGMKVRLAFSVAAHLRPEILIVDEVLAVGDAEFQEKCLGKMKDVAAGGRTVLFVSHNLKAVKELCTRAVVLSGGRVLWTGPVADPFPLPEPEPVPEETAEEEPEPIRVPPYEIPKAERLVYTSSRPSPGARRGTSSSGRGGRRLRGWSSAGLATGRPTRCGTMSRSACGSNMNSTARTRGWACS